MRALVLVLVLLFPALSWAGLITTLDTPYPNAVNPPQLLEVNIGTPTLVDATFMTIPIEYVWSDALWPSGSSPPNRISEAYGIWRSDFEPTYPWEDDLLSGSLADANTFSSEFRVPIRPDNQPWQLDSIRLFSDRPWTMREYQLSEIAAPGVSAAFNANGSVVPEPSTWALFLLGIGLLALWRRRR